MNRRMRSLSVIIGIAVLLVLLRMTLPYWVTSYLNARLATMGSYHGQFSEVDLHLWRGAYTIHDLAIVKNTGKVPLPLLKAPRTELAVRWRDLVRGKVVASVEFYQAELNFVDGRGEADGQSGKGVDWRSQLEKLMPVRIDEIQVIDGVLVFHNFVSEPPVDLRATQVNGSVRNLTNVEDASGRRVAVFDAHAQMLGKAPAEAHAEFDPFNESRDFSLRLRILDIDVVEANDFARAYAKLDFASGHGEFVTELDAHDGHLRGYAKPLFQDLKIFSWKQDVEQQQKNPLRLAWEATAGLFTELFKNHRKDQFATRIEISGEIGATETHPVTAILAILRNAFVEAYKPNFENLEPKPDAKP
ncbi:MAG: hypothetical protein JWQ90_3305 [Hydrocarboniphaga sp.]|uniref:DUF748 domain-containing protein n=1 Tax=Hydrocarboniphaga sp. TaxID=2033016 RepID=UPI0026297434|nr:DUF748 domain-containing protein [Hydrocarboniphaga sp.]MDB5970855.1 hypothetical protein [Hydrocarboniphaga sp.]